MAGSVIAVCISEKKGERKTPVASIEVRENHGIVGDAHAGDWHRQVSLLASESIAKMQALGLDVTTGDFAENITTSGIELVSLPVGTRLVLGEVVLEVTQIGKECHTRCAIYYQAGDCVMPKEGIFARVVQGGTIVPGCPIALLS
jgi:MOSC domain-containing protein YiiM